MAGRIEINLREFHKAFRSDSRYKAYMKRLAQEAVDLMIAEFNAVQRFDNEWRLSETTPPKYVASFHIQFELETGKVYIYNDDPAWNMVEWGAHAGGQTFVLGYKPMTRGFALLAKRPPPPRRRRP